MFDAVLNDQSQMGRASYQKRVSWLEKENLKQNNIANTFQRAIEWEKILYKQMDGDMARVVVKARESYERLEDFEKVQFEAFVQQRIQIAFRGFRAAEESAFLIGAEELRGRVKAHMTDFFASKGVCECYKIHLVWISCGRLGCVQSKLGKNSDP